MIMDDKSIIKRSNLGCPYEMYFNSALQHVEEDIKTLLGFDPTKRLTKEHYEERLTNETANTAAVKELFDLYQLASPIQHRIANDLMANQPNYAVELLSTILHQGIRPYMPPDNPVAYDQAVRKIQARFKPLYGPVTYRGKSGNMVTTKDPVRIANMYVMLLEKVADDGAAVSSSKRQHYGVPAKIS